LHVILLLPLEYWYYSGTFTHTGRRSFIDWSQAALAANKFYHHYQPIITSKHYSNRMSAPWEIHWLHNITTHDWRLRFSPPIS
jgi:hypothetical protein